MIEKTRVETIQMLPFGMLNAFLLINQSNAVLVDTGLPNSEKQVEKVLRGNGLDWSNIRSIVLTHAHIDHAGSAARLRELTGAPIIAHEGDLPQLQGARPLLRPTGAFGRLFHKTGAIQKPFPYFLPDVVLSTGMFDLTDVGIPARILHTPGHTQGSISVLLDDGKVIAGDLAASGVLLGGLILRSRPKQPPFEEIPLQVAKSLKHLLSQSCTRFYLGHGGPLGAGQIRKHAEFLATTGARPTS